ncbi:MAG TPA: divergent PAP2 family protein [Anaerolineales bacterium]|nr:divergent PAP2 family protein [Anaerolineales bacterium]
MNPVRVIGNGVLIAALVAWILAQVAKLPVEYARSRQWNWALLFRAGGMPSSHSALVAATAHGIGLTAGFATPLFALAVAIAMIVIYDATDIRRQAGKHAEIINTIINDLVEGHPLRQEQLREVLGHSPGEALVGTLMGVALAQLLVPLF